MDLAVSKYHGCGNDFILMAHEEIQGWNQQEISRLVRHVCDRHTGIGADGCIFVKTDPLEMIYYNQDGSLADMCGNGIRCFAAYCQDESLISSGIYDVQTLAGTKTISTISKEPFHVQVAMGGPEWGNEKIQASIPDTLWAYPLEIDGEQFLLYSLYMSTIHTVVFVDHPFDPRWEIIGEKIGKHPLFKAQSNVNFVQVKDDHTLMASTWERGCGPTLACGTGMCACALVCRLLNKIGNHADVEMKKGKLHIDIEKDLSVYLSGPAIRIMKGIYYYDEKETA